MKIISFVLPCLLVPAGCSTSSQPEAPKPPQIGMANPASVYCQQKGGTLIPVQTAQGVSNNCKLPGGETIDEWALWRRTIRLVKITAGCCTKITSYVASRPAPAHGSAWCFLLRRAGSAAVFWRCPPAAFLLARVAPVLQDIARERLQNRRLRRERLCAVPLTA